MYKYSVLMSVYKKVEPGEFRLSMDSMLNQTVKPEQIVIVLDGPILDELDKVIKDYLLQFNDIITIVPLKENKGLAVALNEGLKRCRNEYIARMDSDDYSKNTRCEKQLNCFERIPELVLVGTGVENFQGTIDNILPVKKTRPTQFEDIKRTLRRSSPFAHPSVMYKKSAVLACGGYDPELRRRQDYDLFSKMVNGYGYKAINIDEPLLLFRVENSYYSRNKNKESCKSRIKVQKRILKRKECSVLDYMYIWTAMHISMFLPNNMYAVLTNTIKAKRRYEG